MKFFGRDHHQAQLRDLYRAAEEQGEPVTGVSLELQRAFAADRRFMQHLGRVAARGAPANTPIGRATLLAAVAREKSHSLENERRPMIGRPMTGRALALLATAGIFAGGAVTVRASGGVSDATRNVNDVLATLHITDRTPNQAAPHLDSVPQPDPSSTPGDAPPAGLGGVPAKAEQHADDHADHNLQRGAEGGDRAGEGIQTASPQGLDHANSHAPDGPSADEGASHTNVPATPPARANEHGSEDAGKGEASPPAHTDDHSSEGSAHTPGH